VFKPLKLLRLQVSILSGDIVDAGTVFLRIEVVVAHDAGPRISLVQFFQQHAHGEFLSRSAGVGRIAPDVEPALVADADRVGVVVLAVGTDDGLGASWLYLSVTTDDVVVADGLPPASLVPGIYLRCRRRLVGPHCRTVDDDQRNLTHT